MAEESAITTRTRSPNYPSINLEEAIEHIRSIFQSQRRYPSSRDVLVKIMGYRSLNGASAVAVANLSKYGLLEGHGDSLRVSELGQELALHRPGDGEYVRAAREAAARPTFFRQLDEEYSEGLPSEHQLRVSLIKRGFGEKAIPVALRAYRETKDHLRSIDSSFTVGDSPVEPTTSQASDRAAVKLEGTNGTSQLGHRPISIPLPEGAWASLQLPMTMTPSQFDQLVAMLTAMRPSLVVEQSTTASPPGDRIGGGSEPTSA